MPLEVVVYNCKPADVDKLVDSFIANTDIWETGLGSEPIVQSCMTFRNMSSRVQGSAAWDSRTRHSRFRLTQSGTAARGSRSFVRWIPSRMLRHQREAQGPSDVAACPAVARADRRVRMGRPLETSVEVRLGQGRQRAPGREQRTGTTYF